MGSKSVLMIFDAVYRVDHEPLPLRFRRSDGGNDASSRRGCNRRRTLDLPLLYLVQKGLITNVETTRGKLPVPARLFEHPQHNFSFGPFRRSLTYLLQ